MGSLAASEREPLILALWERGAGLARWTREEALLAGDAPPPSRIGARNVALLRLRGHLFERAWPLHSRCPSCMTECEFVADCLALADELDGGAHVDGLDRSIALRPPTVDDLRAVSVLPDEQSAAHALLRRCVLHDEPLADLTEDAAADLVAELERLDPGAVASFALRCPDCGHEWSAAIDVGDAVWSELQRAAEHALIEVDALARAYGWTEDEVLRLSPVRRAAYLQLVGAA